MARTQCRAHHETRGDATFEPHKGCDAERIVSARWRWNLCKSRLRQPGFTWKILKASPNLKTPRVNPFAKIHCWFWTAWLLAPFMVSVFWNHVGWENLSKASSTKLSRPATKEEVEVGGSGQLRMVMWDVRKLGTPKGLTEGNLISLWSVQHFWICRDMNFKTLQTYAGTARTWPGIVQWRHTAIDMMKIICDPALEGMSQVQELNGLGPNIRYQYCGGTDSCSFLNRSDLGANHAQFWEYHHPAWFFKEFTTSWCWRDHHPKDLHHPIIHFTYIRFKNLAIPKLSESCPRFFGWFFGVCY